MPPIFTAVLWACVAASPCTPAKGRVLDTTALDADNQRQAQWQANDWARHRISRELDRNPHHYAVTVAAPRSNDRVEHGRWDRRERRHESWDWEYPHRE